MLEIIHKGGVVMYPLLLLSVVSMAIFIERIYSLRRARITPVDLVSKMRAAALSGNTEILAHLADSRAIALTRVVKAFLDKGKLAAETEAAHEAETLTRFQETLSAVVSISPLLGLLGTVFGMIKLFGVLSGGGIGNAHELSGGIAEALLTTAAGLTVALMAQVFHYIVRSRASLVISALERDLTEILHI